MRFIKELLILFAVTQGLSEAGYAPGEELSGQKPILLRQSSLEEGKGPQGSSQINPSGRSYEYGRRLQPEGKKIPEGSGPIDPNARSLGYARQLHVGWLNGYRIPPASRNARSWGYAHRLQPKEDKVPEGSPSIGSDARSLGYARQLHVGWLNGYRIPPARRNARSWGYAQPIQSEEDKVLGGSPPINPDDRNWGYSRRLQPQAYMPPNHRRPPMNPTDRSWLYSRRLLPEGDKPAEGSAPITTNARSWDYSLRLRPEGDKVSVELTPINSNARRWHRPGPVNKDYNPMKLPGILPLIENLPNMWSLEGNRKLSPPMPAWESDKNHVQTIPHNPVPV